MTRNNDPLITGWREPHGAKLWRVALILSTSHLSTPPNGTIRASLQDFSAYYLPSMETLVWYFHAATGLPVRDTWIRSIKCGIFYSWPGLTYSNTAWYCPSSDKTIMGYILHSRQGVISTKHELYCIQTTIKTTVGPPRKPSRELHIHIEHIRKLYTDENGRFPIRSQSGNKYPMIAYHCDSNTILFFPFKSRNYSHILLAYNDIMTRIKQRNQLVDLKIFDKWATAEYKATMCNIWKVEYQNFLPNIYCFNADKRAIRTFMAHFLSIRTVIAKYFSKNMWDLLIP